MATYPGSFLGKTTLTRERYVSSNLDSYEFLQTRDRAWRFALPRAGVWSATFPKYTVHQYRNGTVLPHLMTLLYNKIHIRPKLLALGNITNAQTQEVVVWNAFFQGMNLEQITKWQADDIVLSGQPAPPLTFLALEDKAWSVGIAADGPAVLDARVNWIFQDDLAVQLRITGQRITVWPWATNWRDEVLERLEWMTSVNISPTGAEQRRSVRLAPRRTFQVQTLAHELGRAYLDLAVFNWGARFWAIPVWHDVQELVIPTQVGDEFVHCRTTDFDFHVGGLVVFRGLNEFEFETGQIKEIEATRLILEKPIQRAWPRRRTKIYPARIAKLLEQPMMNRITDRTYNVQAKFISTEPNDWQPKAPTELYRGKPVFSVPPEESQDLQATHVRLLVGIDNQTDIPTSVDTAGMAFYSIAHSWDPHRRDQHATMRNLFYYLAGRFRSVWMPTFCEDLVLVEQVDQGSYSLDIKNINYTRFGAARMGRRDIRIQFQDGRILTRRILQSAVLENGNERLTMDTMAPYKFLPREVKRISYMMLMRLDQDFIEIKHETDSDGLGYVKTTWRSLRDDLE